MSREELVAIVEAFLNGLANGDVEGLPLHPEVTVESPLFPRTSGAGAWNYVRVLASSVDAIEYLEHIVEGDAVASMFVEHTPRGPLTVFSRFRIEAGLITDARVFYDPRTIADP